MAIDLSPIVSVSEFKSTVGRLETDTVDDTKIAQLLGGITRVLERRMRYAPGMFVPQTALTFVFSAEGGHILRLRDEVGLQYFLRSITADSLKVDVTGDGTYDYLLDDDDLWVEPRPVNAATQGEPYTHIALKPYAAGATITRWPDLESSVQILGNWGWETTPGVIKDRVIGMVREVLDAERAGGAQVSAYDVEEAIQRVPSARALLAVLEREYSRKLPGLA
jgi:hypothetical protein